jgi:hypothetical protein
VDEFYYLLRTESSAFVRQDKKWHYVSECTWQHCLSRMGTEHYYKKKYLFGSFYHHAESIDLSKSIWQRNYYEHIIRDQRA